MSATVVILWNGKRKKIKASPNTLMKAIMEEACSEFDVSADLFSLVHKKNKIDLSQPFRFTGISQNAVIELKQECSGNQQVLIGLSVTNGQRLQSRFSPGSSLFSVLSYFVESGELAPAVLTQNPTVVFMRTALSGNDLRTTTLSTLGLTSGSARLTLQVTESVEAVPVTESSLLLAAAAPMETETKKEVVEDSARPPPEPSQDLLGVAEKKQQAIDEKTNPIEIKQDSKPSAKDLSNPVPMATDTPLEIPEHGEERPGTFMGNGMAGVTAALEAIRSNHFDADATNCILTLMKYTQNLLNKPGDPVPRKIKYSNPAFTNKIASFKGGEAFIRAIGYSLEQEGFSHQIACDPLGCTFLVMKNEDTALLQKVMLRLHQEADSLGIAQEARPKHRPATPAGPTPQNFDPYKSHFSSTAPTIAAEYREPSITERKLNELKAKQEMIEGGIPDRQLQVLLPSAVSEIKTLTQAGNPSAEEAPSDSRLLQQKIARQMAQQRQNEKVPFKTKAMRELEQLQNAKVYSHTVIRIQFPDRVVIQAHFHPRENVGSIADLVKESLSNSNQEFHLYVSPPKTVLQRDQVLAEAQLVPAALIYLSWKDGKALSLQSEGAYLREDLVPAASFTNVQACYPSSVPLAPESNSSKHEEEKRVSLSNKNRDKKKGTGNKPSWLKL